MIQALEMFGACYLYVLCRAFQQRNVAFDKISSTVYYAAFMRHVTDWYDRVDEGDLAPDSLVHHLKHAQACIGMLLDTMGSDMLNDNRPPKVKRTASRLTADTKT